MTSTKLLETPAVAQAVIGSIPCCVVDDRDRDAILHRAAGCAEGGEARMLPIARDDEAELATVLGLAEGETDALAIAGNKVVATGQEARDAAGAPLGHARAPGAR